MEWKAEVTVTGVPLATDTERVAMIGRIRPGGVVSYDASSGTLYMVWRFGDESMLVGAAMSSASYTYRAVLDLVSGIETLSVPPVCTDFRVHLVTPEEEAEELAEFSRIFRKK